MDNLKSILFIDIETVPVQPGYHLLSGGMQKEWERKARTIRLAPDEDPLPATLFGRRAGVFSEFAKVVCIGLGSLYEQDGAWKMRLKALVNDDEKVLLNDFCNTLGRFSSRYGDVRFCGHNIKEFDIPFLCRRMVINAMALPECMQLHGKKPWEVAHLDTMEMWRFGDYKNFTALSLLAEVLGIPSPKTDLDGSMVAGVYWNDRDLQRIGSYCLQDVHTSGKVYLRLTGIHHIDPEPVFASE